MTDNETPQPTADADPPVDAPPAAPPLVDWSLPSWERNPRLENVLGARLAEFDWSHLQSLADRQVPEDQSIDFKRAWYALNRELAAEVMPGRSGDERAERIAKDRRELARDVSAFANASGGLIVLGVAERDGRAQRVLGVGLSDARRLALSDAVRDATTPFISGVEVGFVRDPADEGQGCVLVFVPASAAAPHAVVEPNEARYSWFVRDGAGKVSLREPQVAAAYRDRFAGRAGNEEDVRTVFAGGVLELDREDRCWLAVAVSPSHRGLSRPLGLQAQAESLAATRLRQELLPEDRLGEQVGFGRGRLVLRDSDESFDRAKDHLLHLYTDGRAFAAVNLPVVVAGNLGGAAFEHRDDLKGGTVGIQVDSLTTWVVKLIGVAAGHLVDAGGSGDLELRCSVVTSQMRREEPLMKAGMGLAPVPHVVVNHQVAKPLARVVSGSRAIEKVEPLQLTVSPSVSVDSRELLVVAAQVVSELVAEFGVLPTYPMLTADGLVVAAHCSTRRAQRFADWAKARNLLDEQNT